MASLSTVWGRQFSNIIKGNSLISVGVKCNRNALAYGRNLRDSVRLSRCFSSQSPASGTCCSRRHGSALWSGSSSPNGLGSSTAVQCYCTDGGNQHNGRKNEVYYEELVELMETPGVRLVDVREPKELEDTGRIGDAINIPVTKLKASLSMEEDAFHETYGLSKPKKAVESIIFYGLCSIKSSAALEIATKMGYQKARHYPGGWAEWSQRSK